MLLGAAGVLLIVVVVLEPTAVVGTRISGQQDHIDHDDTSNDYNHLRASCFGEFRGAIKEWNESINERKRTACSTSNKVQHFNLQFGILLIHVNVHKMFF